MKKEKLQSYARRIAVHADAFWVGPVFFLIFLVDSFVVFIPADSLFSTTFVLRPRHLKKWFIWSILGAACGFGLLIYLAHTVLHPFLMESIQGTGFYSQVGKYLEKHAYHYGLIELTVAVFTIVPLMVASLAGVVVGLNPWAIFGIVMAAKMVRLALTVWVVHAGKSAWKKIVSIYVKTNI